MLGFSGCRGPVGHNEERPPSNVQKDHLQVKKHSDKTFKKMFTDLTMFKATWFLTSLKTTEPNNQFTTGLCCKRDQFHQTRRHPTRKNDSKVCTANGIHISCGLSVEWTEFSARCCSLEKPFSATTLCGPPAANVHLRGTLPEPSRTVLAV